MQNPLGAAFARKVLRCKARDEGRMLVLFDEERKRRSWALFTQTLRGGVWRGPPQRPRQGNGAAQAGHTIALPGLAALRLRLARSPALLRALRIVWLFVCGSRRASHPANHRRGPMGFCISLLTCDLAQKAGCGKRNQARSMTAAKKPS